MRLMLLEMEGIVTSLKATQDLRKLKYLSVSLIALTARLLLKWTRVSCNPDKLLEIFCPLVREQFIIHVIHEMNNLKKYL